MRSHIDWLTFTCSPLYLEGNTDLARAILDGLFSQLGTEVFNAILAGEGKQKERSRAPYTYAWTWDEASVTIYASETLNHFTVEVSGQGCERLIALDALDALVQAVQERVTRIDVACDIETRTTPSAFVADVKHKRMQSSGFQKSASGETCYVGSQKSERYARVYRYNEPHPRAHLLRIEHVFRRDHAKLVAKALLDAGMDALVASAGEGFGWAHPTWQAVGDGGVDLSPVGAERNAGKTVYWMVNSVSPAFKRLIADGVIKDPEDFIKRYFYDATGTYA